MRRFPHALLILVAMFCWTDAASAQKRVALVIGNSAYVHTQALANPRNDAGDIAAALASVGFEVVAAWSGASARASRAVGR